MSEQRRPLFWEGTSKKDFKASPVAVQKDMGVALFIAQLGRTAGSAKPWKGLGSGVDERVEDLQSTSAPLQLGGSSPAQPRSCGALAHIRVPDGLLGG